MTVPAHILAVPAHGCSDVAVPEHFMAVQE